MRSHSQFLRGYNPADAPLPGNGLPASHERDVRAVVVGCPQYPSSSSGFWHRLAISSDKRVCDFDRISHHGDDGGFGGFSRSAQAIIFCLEVWVAANGNQCRHIDGIAQWLATASDQRFALPLPGLAGDRSKACQAGHLFAINRRSRDDTDTGHGAQDITPARYSLSSRSALRFRCPATIWRSPNVSLALVWRFRTEIP